MSENNKTVNGAEAYTIHPAIARALTREGFDLGQIVSNVKAQKGRSVIKEESDKVGDVKLREATESRNGESTFVRQVKQTYQNDLSAPMRFAAWTDAMATLFKKHGEPAFEITTAIIPAHLQVWIATQKVEGAESDAPSAPEQNGTGGHRNGKGKGKTVGAPTV